jgi:hypothetical protein
MFFLRMLGRILLFIALAAAAADGVRTIASPGQGLLMTSLSMHLQAYMPDAQKNLEAFFLAYAPSYFWYGIVEPMLVIPVSLLFSLFGVLLFLAGYRRPAPEIVGE